MFLKLISCSLIRRPAFRFSNQEKAASVIVAAVDVAAAAIHLSLPPSSPATTVFAGPDWFECFECAPCTCRSVPFSYASPMSSKRQMARCIFHSGTDDRARCHAFSYAG